MKENVLCVPVDLARRFTGLSIDIGKPYVYQLMHKYSVTATQQKHIHFNYTNLTWTVKVSTKYTACLLKQLNTELDERRCSFYLESRNTPDFVSPLMCPPNSPDLNPVDYEVGCAQETPLPNQNTDVDHLKQRLAEEWRHFSQNIINRTVRQWRVRLRACVCENGGHFEYKL